MKEQRENEEGEAESAVPKVGVGYGQDRLVAGDERGEGREPDQGQPDQGEREGQRGCMPPSGADPAVIACAESTSSNNLISDDRRSKALRNNAVNRGRGGDTRDIDGAGSTHNGGVDDAQEKVAKRRDDHRPHQASVSRPVCEGELDAPVRLSHGLPLPCLFWGAIRCIRDSRDCGGPESAARERN